MTESARERHDATFLVINELFTNHISRVPQVDIAGTPRWPYDQQYHPCTSYAAMGVRVLRYSGAGGQRTRPDGRINTAIKSDYTSVPRLSYVSPRVSQCLNIGNY
ncbi:hypothetical protein J6590_032083 [Homalodisca vitripennis]|nr:hypothetical protein J6590_032083 [Homalodisca vitripennis]